ncbi:MAG: hypothetical protein WCL22_05250 [bacterium]|jgi:hypothetical protein
MVSTIIKLLGQEAVVGTDGNNFNGKTLIRVYNNTAADVAVTVKDAAEAVTGNFTLRAYETVFVRKLPEESMFAGEDIRMVAVAF